MAHRIEMFEVADERYGLSQRFGGAVKNAHEEVPVVVFDGDTHLDALELDWRELDTQLGIAIEDEIALGVVVDGNLIVDRAIMNWDMSYGPFLYVRGSVTAGDLAGGGSEIEIEGDLTLARTLFGFYNHGQILVHGSVRVEVVACEHHLIEVRGTATATVGVAVAGSLLRVVKPEQEKYTHEVLGTSRLALRELDPSIFDVKDWSALTREDDEDLNRIGKPQRRAILKAQAAGRSILRGATPWPVPEWVPGPPAAEDDEDS